MRGEAFTHSTRSEMQRTQMVDEKTFDKLFEVTGNKIGSGSFACVKEAKMENGRVVALKMFNEKVAQLGFEQELKIHNLLVKCDAQGYKKWMVPLIAAFYITDINQFVLVFERAVCSLDNLLYPEDCRRGQVVPFSWCMHAAEQMAKGLAWLHSCGVVHCDIKPGNILFVDKFGLKIADLGSCYTFEEMHCADDWYIQSRYYRAPEVFLRTRKPLNELIDVWSLA